MISTHNHFQKNYESYVVDDITINKDFSKLNEFNIEIFMNTKCHDSEREVPRFLKILNSLNFSTENLRIILLNSDKKTSNGLEIGKNKGSGVDSYDRYIYIHGTHEEGLIGQKASHGCIRMFNQDVIYLYEKVKEGTKVFIRT